MTRRYRTGAWAVMILLAAAPFLAQRAQVETGTQRGRIGVRLAVPEFQAAGAGEKQQRLTAIFNEVLWNDLDYAGPVQLVSRSFHPSARVANPVDVKADDWIKPGPEAEFLAFGNSSIPRPGRFVIEARLWDLKTRPEDREILGQRYTGEDSEESARLIAHQLADRIVQLIGGGVRGIAQTRIAFSSTRDGGKTKEIWVMDYDGSNATQVTSSRSTSILPNWAPDGEKLAFTTFQRGIPGIGVMSWLDRRPFRFEAFPATTTAPAWSPDGSRIAFASSFEKIDQQNDMELFVADWNGRNARRLTVSKGIDISPVWNPRTGREIAFVSDRTGSPQIYIVDAEGGTPRRMIKEGGHAASPSWSPDGQRIAFAWQRNGPNFDIWIYDLALDKASPLTDGPGSNERPVWAPDGRHIAFESTRTGRRNPQIFTMFADGTRIRQLTGTGQNQGPAWSGYLKP